MPEETSRSKIDTLLQKAISRKLLVWLVATGFLVGGVISADVWLPLTAVYLSAQGIADVIAKVRNSG